MGRPRFPSAVRSLRDPLPGTRVSVRLPGYGDGYGFMGFFIVRPDRRGAGLGRELWLARRDRLRARLGPDAAIEMDGVFHMQPFYAAGGFVHQHRDLRFEGRGITAEPAIEVTDLSAVPFTASRRPTALPR